MDASEIREKYLQFFKDRGHAEIASSSLVLEDDPTTLFTGSGMQQLMPYLLGEAHPSGVRLTDSQKSFREEDIDEVGDNRHTTFFEMLGNWSLGDYFKKEQLPWLFEFLTEVVGLDPKRLYVTVYAGDPENNLPKDTESAEIWQSLFAQHSIEAGVAEMITEEGGAERGMHAGERIFYYRGKNWWCRQGSPSKMPVGEPGGPDSEVFYEFATIEHDTKFGANCHPNCDCGRYMEIGNSVFMEYRKTETGFEKLAKQNVDFGGGLERIAAAALDSSDMFAISLLKPLIDSLVAASGKQYEDDPRPFRVVADHIRAATFLIADGVRPGNVGRGYALRRLIRRAVRYADTLGVADAILAVAGATVVQLYQGAYPYLASAEADIRAVFEGEEQKFRKTLKQGSGELARLHKEKASAITGEDLLTVHASYGYPIDLSIEELKTVMPDLDEDELRAQFATAMDKHREASRAGVEKKFGGHGLILDTGELKAATPEEVVIVTKLHTATHLLQSALRQVLGNEVRQSGSDITAERTRFDFNFERKLTPEELQAVEDLVNEKINEDLPVHMVEMPKDEALAAGALAFFKAKYADIVKVYYMGETLETAWSKEFCGGPHVEHTNQVVKFKIKKEEAVAAGVRRIRGVLA